MFHIFIESYTEKGQPRQIRIELDNELRPQLIRLLENLNSKMEREERERKAQEET